MRVQPDVVIEQVDLPSVSEEDIVRMNAFNNALKAESRPEDPPTPIELTRENVRNIPGFVDFRIWWVRDDAGDIAAQAEASFMKTEENRHLVWGGIHVLPAHRRKGLAKALLPKIVEYAESENRTLLMGHTHERVPAGEALMKRIGAEPGLAMHTNRLALDELDRDLVAAWVVEGPQRASGYSLVTLDGPFPEDILPEIADLKNVMNTAPRDDLDIEDFEFKPDQLREMERTIFADGTERWFLGARHDESGELAGYTEVYYNAKLPNTVHQGDTGVRPEHRGHALGKWLKAAMLDRIVRERPDAKDVRTGNADSNDAMLAINRQLGFKPYIAHMDWQVPVERVRAYLDD